MSFQIHLPRKSRNLPKSTVYGRSGIGLSGA